MRVSSKRCAENANGGPNSGQSAARNPAIGAVSVDFMDMLTKK
jgi:hypothetical protein